MGCSCGSLWQQTGVTDRFNARCTITVVMDLQSARVGRALFGADSLDAEWCFVFWNWCGNNSLAIWIAS